MIWRLKMSDKPNVSQWLPYAATPQDLIGKAVSVLSPKLSFACSFGLEDIVLIDMISKTGGAVTIFALDTGRLPEETYQCAEEVSSRYGLQVDWYFPHAQKVEELTSVKGLYSFRQDVDSRKHCCALRKVEPLSRALLGEAGWITGQRQQQSVTRQNLSPVEIDSHHDNMWKFNPLADWSLDSVWQYVREHGLVYNQLHDKGYPSIGCAPCTRAITQGENERAGRWWWESAENKECGLHPDYFAKESKDDKG